MKRHILTLILSLVTLCSYGQSGRLIYGCVYGERKMPLQGAKITTPHGELICTTDQNGQFNAQSSTYIKEIVVLHDDYQTKYVKVDGSYLIIKMRAATQTHTETTDNVVDAEEEVQTTNLIAEHEARIDAEHANVEKEEMRSGFFSNMTTDNYWRWHISYNHLKNVALSLQHGFGVGFIGSINLTSKAPIYFEYGLNYQASFGKSLDYGYIHKSYMHSLNIPLNFALRLSFGDNKVSITPYVGLNNRINLACKVKDLINDSYYTTNIFKYRSEYRRFQIGMNLGVGFSFKAIYFGIGHTFDFMNFVAPFKETKFGVTSISVGVNF